MSSERTHGGESPNAPALGPEPTPGGRLFWATTSIGLLVIGFGVFGLLSESRFTQPENWLTFFVGGLLLHDLVAAPLIALISVILVRFVPARVRPVVQGTLIVAGAVALVAIPVVGGWGKLANNPSLLPLDYGRNLVIVLTVIVGIGALLALRALRRAPTATDSPAPYRDDRRPDGW